MEKRVGARGVGKKVGLHDASPLLDDIGINHWQSHRWQTEALVPEKDFEKFVAEIKDDGNKELTSREL